MINEWQALGVQITNGDQSQSTFGSDARALAWLTEQKKLHGLGAMARDSISGGGDPNQLYAAGLLALGSPSPSFLRNVLQNGPKVYATTGVAPYPKLPNGKTVAGFGQFITVPATSTNTATALAFAKFLLSPESQTAWCKDPKVMIFPSTSASLKDPFFSESDTFTPLGKARKLAAEALSEAGGRTIWPWTSAPGFAFWYAHRYGGSSYYQAPIWKNGEPATEERYFTTAVTEEAICFLHERDPGRPFYLQINYTAPHAPWIDNHPRETAGSVRGLQLRLGTQTRAASLVRPAGRVR
ncbi:extracellular solute-binding protein [Kribbella solani]|uniref:extracellular solute-binding protein n=1 Tax=Kribbella solani TaxID=236067 RepID=UPI0029AD0918|nr:extracellular solute-binding protein [Kribbella solani]MDX3006551.1 extracellular solute-binding protein [Kribbella solani]